MQVLWDASLLVGNLVDPVVHLASELFTLVLDPRRILTLPLRLSHTSSESVTDLLPSKQTSPAEARLLLDGPQPVPAEEDAQVCTSIPTRTFQYPQYQAVGRRPDEVMDTIKEGVSAIMGRTQQMYSKEEEQQQEEPTDQGDQPVTKDRKQQGAAVDRRPEVSSQCTCKLMHVQAPVLL